MSPRTAPIPAALLFIALATTPVAAGERPPGRAVSLVDVSFDSDSPFFEISGSLVGDGSSCYLGTPGGLFRLDARIVPGSAVELVAFEGRPIRNLYVHQGALYVLKHVKESSNGSATDHAFLRSWDRGETFEALDFGLEECLGGYCSFLSPSQAVFRDGTIFTNAGGNLLALHNGAWIPLIGGIAQMACYDPAFTVEGDRVIIGGECPLDVAYIRAGVLRNGFLEWELSPVDAITPPLENRNVHFVEFIDGGPVVLAGVEGAILRSTDHGASFDFALHYEVDGPVYPYVSNLLVVDPAGGGLIAGGWDKATFVPWLAWSSDQGASWTDLSEFLMHGHPGFEAVVFLHQDNEGRILAGLLDVEASVIRIVELQEASPRRRGVRR